VHNERKGCNRILYVALAKRGIIFVGKGSFHLNFPFNKGGTGKTTGCVLLPKHEGFNTRQRGARFSTGRKRRGTCLIKISAGKKAIDKRRPLAQRKQWQLSRIL